MFKVSAGMAVHDRSFHALVLGVLLVLNCSLNPLRHTAIKSQVELDQANLNTESSTINEPFGALGSTHHISAFYQYGSVQLVTFVLTKPKWNMRNKRKMAEAI